MRGRKEEEGNEEYNRLFKLTKWQKRIAIDSVNKRNEQANR